MAKEKTTEEEPLLTLPIGHPEAGYTSPDVSEADGGGATGPERKWASERDKARDAEAAAVAEHEHKVATAEAKAREKEQAKA